jgi:hypothetical protein
MKQLTIMCSSDLADEVQAALVSASVEGFLQVPNVVGNRPAAAAEHGRVPHWDAEMFIAAIEDEALEPLVARLREHADKCEAGPCLRILVKSLDAVY